MPTTVGPFIQEVIVADLPFFVQTMAFCPYVFQIDAAFSVAQVAGFSAIR